MKPCKLAHYAILALALGRLDLAHGQASPSPSVPYSVIAPEKRWDISRGHHRALVEVQTAAPAVVAHLPWRLQLQGMERRAILVIGPDGKQVANATRLTVSREAADIAFEAATQGTYEIYYLPFAPKWNWIGCNTSYTPYKETATPEWLDKNQIALNQRASESWRRLPTVHPTTFQSRSDFDRFDPMEVIATQSETQAFLSNHPEPFHLFPEDRQFPIKMQRDLPARWLTLGQGSSTFKGSAAKNEYYAFQIGVYAAATKLDALEVTASALQGPGGSSIPADSIVCYNIQGRDTWGKPMTRTVNVAQGAVQPLWLGIDVPQTQAPGLYRGSITVGGKNTPKKSVAVELTVTDKVLADRGDGDPIKMSRLRWLNSKAGLEDTVVKPYTPLAVDGTSISCLGRKVVVGPNGLPSTISAGTHEVLAKPADFIVETANGRLVFQPSAATVIQRDHEARAHWQSQATSAAAKLICHGEMEFDGHLRYRVELEASADLQVKDIRLELPYRPESATYRMGLGSWGGLRPKQETWKWQGPSDSFWLGGVHSGLWCELRGGSYHGPMLNLYHPAPPVSWHNGGKGMVTHQETQGTVLATASSGERSLKTGERITFEFDLIVTPVKPLDTQAQFRNRYWHICPPEGDRRIPEPTDVVDPTADALQAGANVVNLHHSTPRNPYINYPFHTNDLISPFVKDMHRKGVKVKLYYTLRELSNYVSELWLLRSLGNEVIANGGGGGFAWLQEHLLTGYTPAWYSPFHDGTADASFVTSGESRWYNSYVEGLGWMIDHFDIDGLYLDDVSYDRHILQRMRRIMDRHKPGCMIDLHSNTDFSKGPANQYLEFFPYIDRLWFGESFDYEKMSPDEWLVQTSGIPFGLMGEMLANGGNPWRGTLYGMTSRLAWLTNNIPSDPRPVWKVWDRFGIKDATMLGYWEPDCPVKTDRNDILATVYQRPGRTMIAIASWAPNPTDVQLQIDWKRLGIDPTKAVIYSPHAAGFQPFRQWQTHAPIHVLPHKGWLILIDENGPQAEDRTPPDNADILSHHRLITTETFTASLGQHWKSHLSKIQGTGIHTTAEGLRIEAPANACAYLSTPLPAHTQVVDCRILNGSDQGETWGPGLALRWKSGQAIRINLRGREGNFSVDSSAGTQIRGGRLDKNQPVSLRIRLTATEVIAEAGNPDGAWTRLAAYPRNAFPGDPETVCIGKSFGITDDSDHTDPGTPGATTIQNLRIYTPK